MNQLSQLQLLVLRNVATWRKQNAGKVSPTADEKAYENARARRARQYQYGIRRAPLVCVGDAMPV